jgi:S-adenosylmethionine synthetase
MMVETFGTSEVDPEKLPGLLQDLFDLRPAAIIERLDLRRPIYQQTAAYGHFGRSERDFTWERTDPAAELKAAAEGIA